MSGISVLCLTAASIGFFHTLLGPDHYVPFIVMGKARKWSLAKTFWVTFACGIGHVGSSVILGLIGAAVGVAVSKLEMFESVRGEWAAWGLILFGMLYFIYGLRQGIKNKPHTHLHVHSDGTLHEHQHVHKSEHAHLHEEAVRRQTTVWALFIIFVLGPCEPLIPLLMYPAAKYSFLSMMMVAGVFSAITIATMLGVVFVGVAGFKIIPMKFFERYMHALAGFAIFMCGFAVQFLGL